MREKEWEAKYWWLIEDYICYVYKDKVIKFDILYKVWFESVPVSFSDSEPYVWFEKDKQFCMVVITKLSKTYWKITLCKSMLDIM